MTRPTPTTIPCEQPGCPLPAAMLATRIDAARDWFYGCRQHATDWWSMRAAELSPLARYPLTHDGPAPQVTLPLVLSMWRPRHRQKSKVAARAIVDAAVAASGPAR